MSWDVILSSPSKGLGTKDQARESIITACEQIIGEEIPRRGPTEVKIDDSFAYEVLFIGHKRAVESITLCISLIAGDPHGEPEHPVWSFLRRLCEHTGWEAHDTHNGAPISWVGLTKR
jgi:hypothetical protein